jgi:hypothetical protein
VTKSWPTSCASLRPAGFRFAGGGVEVLAVVVGEVDDGALVVLDAVADGAPVVLGADLAVLDEIAAPFGPAVQAVATADTASSDPNSGAAR